ncbi:DUF362 domain-containing protein [Desulfomarina sp.]
MDHCKPVVVLQRCSQYNRVKISEKIDAVVSCLGVNPCFYNKKVLLKPNLISGKGPEFSCTHRTFVAGVALWFQEQGAQVAIGDSPALGSSSTVCRRMGIAEEIADLDVQLVDFSSSVEKKTAGNIRVNIAVPVIECDYLINLPKLKAHNQLYVTLAVKNIFGIVKGANKALLHMLHGSTHDGFAEIILDLLDFLPPSIHCIDGIAVMHCSGPLDGEALPLHCIGGSLDPVALDTALLDLLELEKKKSPLWRVAAGRGLVGTQSDKISFPLLRPADFHGSGFQAPVMLNGIRFNPFRFLLGMGKRLFAFLR